MDVAHCVYVGSSEFMFIIIVIVANNDNIIVGKDFLSGVLVPLSTQFMACTGTFMRLYGGGD